MAGDGGAEARVHGAAGEHADHADGAADPDGLQWFRRGALAADLDDVVHACAAGNLAGAPAPASRR